MAKEERAVCKLDLVDGVGLTEGRVHEVQGHAALGIALAAASATSGLVFWAGGAGDTFALRARGLAHYFDVARLVTVQTANRRETLWAMEKALRCAGAGLVVAHVGLGPDLFESRRLQVAAQTGGALGLVIVGRRAQASAAQSRWQCEPAGQTAGQDASWRWRMTKNRSGQLREWGVRCERPPDACLPPDLRSKPVTLNTTSSTHDTDPVFATLSAAPLRVVSSACARPLAPA